MSKLLKLRNISSRVASVKIESFPIFSRSQQFYARFDARVLLAPVSLRWRGAAFSIQVVACTEKDCDLLEEGPLRGRDSR